MTITRPWLSVITVCRQAGETIENTALSLRGQSVQNYQWVIIDGASTDGTCQLVAPYLRPGDLLISEPDTGIYDAMNKGMHLAKGQYLFFLNSGDLLYEVFSFENIASALSDQSELPILIYGKLRFVDPRHGFREVVSSGHSIWDFVCSRPPHHQASFFRADALRAARGFSPNYGLSADMGVIAALRRAYPSGFLKLESIVSDFNLGGASSQFVWNFKNERDRTRAVFDNLGWFVGAAHVLHATSICFRSFLRFFLDKTGLLITWRKMKSLVRPGRYSVNKEDRK